MRERSPCDQLTEGRVPPGSSGEVEGHPGMVSGSGGGRGGGKGVQNADTSHTSVRLKKKGYVPCSGRGTEGRLCQSGGHT